jgi:hypothetical protein
MDIHIEKYENTFNFTLKTILRIIWTRNLDQGEQIIFTSFILKVPCIKAHHIGGN